MGGRDRPVVSCFPVIFLNRPQGVSETKVSLRPGTLPVPGVHQLRTQAELLQGLVAHHDDDGGGSGRDDASGKALGEPPGTLLSYQLLEGQDDGALAPHLQGERTGPPFEVQKSR